MSTIFNKNAKKQEEQLSGENVGEVIDATLAQQKEVRPMQYSPDSETVVTQGGNVVRSAEDMKAYEQRLKKYGSQK